jgi:pyrroline-5-carboxylate reductase
MLKEKIGVIGAGKIGVAILRGLVGAGVDKNRLVASAPREEHRERLARELGIGVTVDNGEVCAFADIVILAVKPQVLPSVLQAVGRRLDKNKLVISVAAGIPTDRIEGFLQSGARVVRVMTNTPAVVGAATSAYAPGARATPADLRTVEEILRGIGIALPVDERLLDAVTGLSGSGPAYVFLFAEALADGGVRVGLTRETAVRLALQTIYGAAKLALESGEPLSRLRDNVTSPGGTTIAGLNALEKGGLRATVMEAIIQATRRAEALGRGEP